MNARVFVGIKRRSGKTIQALTWGRHHSGKTRTSSFSQTSYLQTVLEFLGMTDVSFIYAEGLAMGEAFERLALQRGRKQDCGRGRVMRAIKQLIGEEHEHTITPGRQRPPFP